MVTAHAHGDDTTAPRWLLLLPAAYVAHLCEEWWGGPGFPAWTQATFGAEISPTRFLAINAIALPLFIAGTIGAVRNHRFALVAAAFSALFFVNGVVHLLASAAFGTYSPGTITGALLYLPLGGFALVSMSRLLPSPVFSRAVFAGIAAHALVSFVAFL